jgi:iduronate 2-sulfatase
VRCLLGALATCCVLGGNASAAEKPNVLLICVDDLKPLLGCYGDQTVKSPNIDRLAARGVLFQRAFCNQAVCAPSRNALMTGLRPTTLGIYDLETFFRKAAPDAVTLAQHFCRHGYRAEALGKIFHVGHGNHDDAVSWSVPHWSPKGGGYALPENAGRGAKPAAKTKPDGAPAAKPASPPKGAATESADVPDNTYADGKIADEAIRRLRTAKEKPSEPFFLAVGFLKPHLPFVAPKKYWDLYDADKIPVPAIDKLPQGSPPFAGHVNGELHSYANVPKGEPIPVDFAKQLRHGYYACISYTDAQVGRLLDALDKEGLADNTIVVLWGDHGWQLGDHGLWHKHTNFELATRAPLMLSIPKQKTAGTKCSSPVEFVDVYPTLADLCGLPIPKGLDGLSLKPQIENPATPSTKVAISQYPRGGGKTGLGQLMGYSIRDDRWRLTVWRSRKDGTIAATELYDETNDPNETVNVADKPENKAVIEKLSKMLPPLSASSVK